MSKTNAAVLQETIEECEKKILKIEARDREISQLLRDAENGTECVQAGAQKWERKRSECFEFVRSGSLLLIPMACSLFGISNDVAMQVVGVGFIIGVIQDSVETAINSSSDALFTAVAEFKQWRKAGKEIKF